MSRRKLTYKFSYTEIQLELEKSKDKIQIDIKNDKIKLKIPKHFKNKDIKQLLDDYFKAVGISDRDLTDFFIFGKRYKLIEKAIKRKWIIFEKRGIIILNPKNKLKFLEFVVKKLENYVKDVIKKYKIKIGMNKKIEIKMENLKYIFGSADLNNNIIVLNSFLFYLPKEIINLIIFHEILHILTRKDDHDRLFRKMLKKEFPHYNFLNKEIKKWIIILNFNKWINEFSKILKERRLAES